MAFIPFETENSECTRRTDIARLQESIFGNFTSPVSGAEELIQSRSGTEWRERKMRTLHQSVRMSSDGLKATCTAGFRAISKRSKALICFPTFVYYVLISLRVAMLVGFDIGCL